MKENKHDIKKMQELAEAGWRKMHQTLVEQGLSTEAASDNNSPKRRNLLFLIAACLFFFFIFSYPYLINDGNRFLLKSRQFATNPESLNASPFIQSLATAPFEDQIHFQKDSMDTASVRKQIIRKQLNHFYKDYKSKIFEHLSPNEKRYLLQKFSTDKARVPAIPPSDNEIDPDIHIEKSASLETAPHRSLTKRPRLFIGVGINSPGLNDLSHSFNLNDFTIHPLISVIFPLSEKLSLRTGLSAFSVIHGKQASAKEKELPNNFANPNIYYSINTITIIKASYFDIPFTFNYSLNTNWSTGAGVQLSKLYKVNIREEKESFNYSNTLYATSIARYNATPMGARAAFQKKVEIKKLEPVLVAETNFHQGRFLFSAGYYYGLHKSILIKDNYNSVEHYRNQYFKLGIQFTISNK